MSSGGLRGCFRIPRYRPNLRDEVLNTLQTPPLLMSRCCVLPFFHFILAISHLVSVFVVRWLGGSFAIFWL